MLKKKDLLYSIDTITKDNTDHSITLIGWASSADPHDIVHFDVTDGDGNHIPYTKERTMRNDVSIARFSRVTEEGFGFTITFEYHPEKKYFIRFFNSSSSNTVKISGQYIVLDNLFKKATSFFDAGKQDEKNRKKKMEYDKWYRQIRPTNKDLARQRNHVFPENSPKFSVVIPLYKTPVPYLDALIQSFKDQTYSKFEICFADGSPAEDKLEEQVQQLTKKDPRFLYHFIGENKGISGNTNEALKMATGDFIVLCDHDDLVTPDAFYEFAKAITENPDCDTIYSDEDKINGEGTLYFEPHFKPDFNIDLLTSTNYICHLFGVRRTCVEKYGSFRSEYDGAQDYDFILRMCENSRKIIHVAKILYHWRTHALSTSSNPESKMYAFEAGAHAIEAHYKRIWPNIKIDRVENGVSLGIYKTDFHFDEYPLVSIIIPNKDHHEDLDQAVRSVITKSTWKNLEFIIVENNSELPETFEYYKKIEQEFPQVHVVHYEGSFNYSRINNFGVAHAHGDYLLFMNNDVEMIEPDSIENLVGYGQREDVGIVGCLLLYPDNTIQHAGAIIGVRGIADHVFNGMPVVNATYFNRALTAQDYSAVTAAVMLTKRSIFDAVHGFDESYAVAFNDIDFCLKVGAMHKLVAYTPYATFHHYESKSRGYDDVYEKKLRFASEIKQFLTKWKDTVMQGDPCYNPNLTVQKSDYSLRNLYVERIGGSFYGEHYIHEILTKSPEEIVEHPIQNKRK